MSLDRLTYRLSGPALLVGLLVISLLCGCRHSIDPLLAKADALMEEHPDSSMMILTRIEPQKITNDEDKALYGLLYTQARDKNQLTLEDDSLIKYSIQYYEEEHDILRLGQSLYFLGRVLYKQKHYSRAIVCFHKSLELAENIQDFYLAGMSCRGIADIYNDTFNSSDQVKFAQKELEYLRLSERQPYINYAHTDLARALYVNKDTERMVEVLKAAEDSARLYEDAYLLNEIIRLKVLSLIRDKDFEAAYPLIVDINASQYAESDDSLLLALTFYGVGQFDKAKLIMSDIGNHTSDLYHMAKYNIHKANGDYREALAQLEYLDSVADRSLRIGVSHSLTSSLSDHFEIDRIARESEFKASRIILMSTILFALIIIAVLAAGIWWYVRSNHLKMEERIRIAESLRSELELQRKNNLKDEEYKRLLLTDNFQVVEDFGRIMMENPDSKKALKKSAEAVSRFLDELSCWGNRTKELERKVDMACDNLFSDFRNDMPGLKDLDYLLYLYSILQVSIPTISIILKEPKIESIYNRKRRLKDKIKLLDADKSQRYLKYL